MDDNGEDVDMEYSYQSDVANEPYEYVSEDGSLTGPLEGSKEIIGSDERRFSDHSLEPLVEEASDLYEQLRSATLAAYLVTTDSSTAPILGGAGMDAANDSDSSEDREDFTDRFRRCARKEHFAGPGCVHQHGYAGSRITAEEMKGCNVLQCLFRKEPNWTPEPDDQPFELFGRYYLSGLSGHVPSRDYDHPQYAVERHNHGNERGPDDMLLDVSTASKS